MVRARSIDGYPHFMRFLPEFSPLCGIVSLSKIKFMLQFSIIGNLGADAQLKQSNGRSFVSFNVGHNESWTNAEGQTVETTQWVSCAIAGDGGKLLPFLKRGKQVFVQGRGSVRVYSSPKTHRMEAGLNIAVDKLELVGGRVDEVPSLLYDADGIERRVMKTYFISDEDAKAIGVKKGQPQLLQTAAGQLFDVSFPCWVTPRADSSASEKQNTENNE